MLRAPSIDAGVVEMARPMIEGFIRGDELSWELDVAHNVGLQFEVEEFA